MNAPNSSIKARLLWDDDATEALDALFANQLFISCTDTEVTLIFGTALSPPFTEPPQDDIEIRIKPVAKVVMSGQAMENFLVVINRTFEDDQEKDNE